MEIRHEIQAVVNYLFRDEQRQWEELGKPRRHIFHSVARVSYFLEDGGIVVPANFTEDEAGKRTYDVEGMRDEFESELRKLTAENN